MYITLKINDVCSDLQKKIRLKKQHEINSVTFLEFIIFGNIYKSFKCSNPAENRFFYKLAVGVK